jgi:hypothetical protein
MKRIIIALLLLSASSFFCGSSRQIVASYKQTVIINKDTLYAISFEANLIKIESRGVSNELLTGIKYNKEIIQKLSDSCEIMIGTDANYQIQIGNIEYFENKFNLKKASLLKLHVHSPNRVFGFGPEIGKRYKFNLFYTNKDENNIEFNYLEARELK